MTELEEILVGVALDRAVAIAFRKESLTARTPAEIGRAVTSGLCCNSPRFGTDPLINDMTYEWNRTEYVIVNQGSKWGLGGADGNDGYGYSVWLIREGQPWQADLEAHVSCWVKPVPRVSTDLIAAMQLMEEFCERFGSDYTLTKNGDKRTCFMTPTGYTEPVYKGQGKTEAEAIARAILQFSEVYNWRTTECE